MNKRIIIGLCLVLVVGLLAFKNYQNNKSKVLGISTKNQPIKIGAIYDLSGVFADGGKAFQEGTQIALEEINSQGGINGHPVEVIYEDGKDLAAKPTVDAAQKLIYINKVSAILDISYSGLSSLQNLGEQSKTPILDVIDASDEMAALGDWVFGVGLYDNGQGALPADFAINDLKIKKAALLVGKDEYLLTVGNAFEKRFKELGGEITAREEFVVGETDFRTQLTKIKNSGAEAIFFAHLGEGGYGIKQANELGFKGYFLGTDPMSIADVQRAAGSVLNDRTFFALWRNFDQFTPEQKSFAEKYKAKMTKRRFFNRTMDRLS